MLMSQTGLRIVFSVVWMLGRNIRGRVENLIVLI